MDAQISKLNQINNIKIGYDLEIASDFQAQNLKYSSIIIITDSNLESLYLEQLKSQFNTSGISSKLLSLVIPPGEGSKSRDTKSYIEDWLLEHQCDRDSCLIALGGGVIGDLIGFVASTYLRGISLIHVPTSLLAMVDSSIGGKNGIDTKHGKNLIGTFYFPKRNYINLTFLKSLPSREFYNGMAEIIKMAIISNKSEFEKLEVDDDINPSIDVHSKNLLHVVTRAVEYKTWVVEQDGKDAGLRHLLNFGHTIGHGIEAIFSPKLLHGECVAIGMILETKIAVRLGHCSPEVLTRLEQILLKYKLPISLSQTLFELKDETFNIYPSVEQIIKILGVDKKNSGGNIRLVLLSDIGATVEPRATAVPTAEIEKVLYEEFESFITKVVNTQFGQNLSPINSSRIPSPSDVEKSPSFFLCLTLPDLSSIESNLSNLTKGVDAIEIRPDILTHPLDFKFESNLSLQSYLSFISSQVAILRKAVPNLPIIYTPRTKSEGGLLPDDLPMHCFLAIYLLGFHLGCEIIDVQICLSQNLIDSIINTKKIYPSIKVLASYHQWNDSLDWTGIECQKYIQKGSTFADLIKIVSVAKSSEDNDKIEEFSKNYWKSSTSKKLPLIAINIGKLGELSRVRNRYLTPVTHKDLPPAAPGQLTVEQILENRKSL